MTHKTKIFYSLFFLILPTVLLAQNSIPNNIEMNFLDKNILLYTTAKDTDLRLTKQPDQIFRKRVQPLETEVSIFVNPNKKFQKNDYFFLIFAIPSIVCFVLGAENYNYLFFIGIGIVLYLSLIHI